MDRYIRKDNLKEIQLITTTTRKKCRTFSKREDYFIRVKTSLKKEFAEFLVDKASSYQVALEGDNESNYHIQCVVKFNEKVDSKIKESIRQWYKKYVSKPKIDTYYSCKRIRTNALRALAYNYKEDTQVIEFNINEDDIKIAKMLSHGKDTKQFNKKLEDLKERFFSSSMIVIDLTESIILLKSDFNQNIYLNHIEAQVRYIMIRKDKRYARQFASRIVERIFD